MTFFEKTKRFFEPISGQKFLVALTLFKFSTWVLNTLFSVYIVRESVRLYGIGDFEGFRTLIWQFSAFITVFLFIAYILRRVDWPILWHAMQRWIYSKYIREIIEMDGNMLEKIGTGRMIAVVTGAEKTWIDAILHVLKEGTKIGLVSLYLFFLLFSKSFFFGGVFLLLLIGLHILVVYLDSYAHKNRAIRTEKKAEFTRELVRIIMSRNDILQSGGGEEVFQKSRILINEMEEANNGINLAIFQIFNLVRVLAALLRIAFLIIILYLHDKGALSMADVAGMFALLIVFESFLFDSTEFYKNFTKDFSDIEKLWRMFDDAPKLKGYHTGSPFTPTNKPIIIKDITYGYNDTKVFQNFSLTIEKGKKTALVGASGGGKTTLMKLIAGYLHPDEGYISVLGNRLDETALKTYYPHIGYLTQDPSVFDGTIRENLISSVSNVSNVSTGSIHTGEKLEKKLTEALSLAHCDFVFELEHGLDTEIGERGVRLSGGQKQRLAIAKIFLKNPEIILLDEPTSALDSFSEEQITKALDTLFKDRTVLIIAHRLQTVKKADDIIVIEGGNIEERGSHEQLIAKGGIYHKMLELQSGF